MAKTKAQLAADGYDIRALGDKYAADRMTIANTVLGQVIPFGDVDTGTSLEIISETSGKEISLHINGGEPIIIAGEETIVIDEQLMTSLTLDNGSGATVTLRYRLWGV